MDLVVFKAIFQLNFDDILGVSNLNYKKIINQLPELEIFKDNEYDLQISYRYQKFNQEIPILFLHGFNGNSKSWAYQFDYFKEKRSIIAIDAPGFGQ